MRIIVRRKVPYLFSSTALLLVVAFSSLGQTGWVHSTVNSGGDLVAVYFTSDREGWIAGDGGYLASTNDGGRTWSNRVRVSDGLNTRTTLFPWLETGPTPGSVGIVWYGTSNPVNNDDANWHVFYAQSFNADEEVPADHSWPAWERLCDWSASISRRLAR